MTDNGGNWKAWALALVTGLLVGMLSTGGVGMIQSGKLEKRLQEQISKVEVREEKNFEIIIAMSERLVRIETKLDQINGSE